MSILIICKRKADYRGYLSFQSPSDSIDLRKKINQGFLMPLQWNIDKTQGILKIQKA